MSLKRERLVGEKIQRVGRVGIATHGRGQCIAAAIGMLARPTLVGFGERRRGVPQGLGGIDRFSLRRRLGPLVQIDRSLGEERVLLELLLEIGRKFELGELQQLDRLLQLRRHGQGLPRCDDQTGTDTHQFSPKTRVPIPSREVNARIVPKLSL